MSKVQSTVVMTERPQLHEKQHCITFRKETVNCLTADEEEHLSFSFSAASVFLFLLNKVVVKCGCRIQGKRKSKSRRISF